MATKKRELLTAIWVNEGREYTVQPPDTKTLPGNMHYDSELHEGNLVSRRGLPVRLQPARLVSGGSSGPGARAHFVEAARPSKADFVGPPLPLHLKSEPRYNRSLGYRIHINTAHYTPEFNEEKTLGKTSGVYKRTDGGRLTFNEGYDHLRRMEPVNITTMPQLVDFIKRSDPARLLKSEVIFQNNAQSWEETFIPKGKPSRVRALVERLEEYDNREEPPFAIIVVQTTEKHDPNFTRKAQFDDKGRWDEPHRGRWQRIPAPIEPIKIHRDAEVYAQYGIYVDELVDEKTRECMRDPDCYMAMGETRYENSPQPSRGRLVHYINLKITDAAQVMAVDMKEIELAVRHNAEKSAKRRAVEPSNP